MNTFHSNVCGIPCLIRVLDATPFVPAVIGSDPSRSCAQDSGHVEFEILDRKGKPAPWLTRKMNDKEYTRIEQEAFNITFDYT